MVPSKVFHQILIFCVLSLVTYQEIGRVVGFCNAIHTLSYPLDWVQVSLC